MTPAGLGPIRKMSWAFAYEHAANKSAETARVRIMVLPSNQFSLKSNFWASRLSGSARNFR